MESHAHIRIFRCLPPLRVPIKHFTDSTLSSPPPSWLFGPHHSPQSKPVLDKAAVKTWEKPTRKKLGYIGEAKYFYITLSIALCSWVVYAVKTGDKPMGHWLLAVPAWWQKKKTFCRPLKCVGPPGKCPLCLITNPALVDMFYCSKNTLFFKYCTLL